MSRIVFLFLGVLFVSPALAAEDADPYAPFRPQSDYREELEVPWVEMETKVKRLPRDEDLREIVLDRIPAELKLYADLENISLDERDRVLRTWLVMKSSKGAYNGTYEGYRCSTGEYKVYAHGNPQHSRPLRVVEFPRWREIRKGSWREELARDNFCHGVSARSLHEIKNARTKRATDYEPLGYH